LSVRADEVFRRRLHHVHSVVDALIAEQPRLGPEYVSYRLQLGISALSLAGLVPLFEPTAVTHVDGGDGRLSNLEATVHLARLLTDLGIARDAAEAATAGGKHVEQDEYDRLCDLIFAEPAAAAAS
jgi:hypothetical protein